VNSSNSKQKHTLAWVTPERARNFLERLVNLRPEDRSFMTFEEQYGRFLRGFGHELGSGDQLPSEQLQFARSIRHAQVAFLQMTLRQLWKADTIREKRFRLFELGTQTLHSLQQHLARKRLGIRAEDAIAGNIVACDSLSESMPPPHPIEDVLRCLESCMANTRYCANPSCLEPYFIANRKSQKYCSLECSRPSQREFKRRWWRARGRKWRQKRRNTKKGRNKC
jgi:hypothetical protein